MPPLPTISIPPYFPNCVFIAKPEPDRSSGTDFESPAGEALWSGHYVICADGGFRKIPLPRSQIGPTLRIMPEATLEGSKLNTNVTKLLTQSLGKLLTLHTFQP